MGVRMVSNAEFVGTLIDSIGSLNTVTTNKSITFYDTPAAFDIETSSFYKNDIKTAIMYEWTFGIGFKENDTFRTLITYGRTWDSFITLLHAVSVILGTNPENKRLVVYVHNLPYEWQWIRKRFSWTKVFYLDIRKPVYAITDTGIEFRCSLKLSGKSLANTAKDLVKYKTEKMVGDLDYNLVRHSKTPLTEKELGYCEHDILVLLNYIQEKIESDGNISRIPLTKTGYVRRKCRNATFQKGEELYAIADCYEELDFEARGVSPAERSFSGWLYPRFSSENRYDSEESWFIRLYQFLSERHSF